tara:strand:+ start:407 stop:526 length:120 start_codon:yes stop_codon:yes gene_type:complete
MDLEWLKLAYFQGKRRKLIFGFKKSSLVDSLQPFTMLFA